MMEIGFCKKPTDLIDYWTKTRFWNGIVTEGNEGMLMDKYMLRDMVQNKSKKRRKSSQNISSQ